jgi:hypothetical protein
LIAPASLLPTPPPVVIQIACLDANDAAKGRILNEIREGGDQTALGECSKRHYARLPSWLSTTAKRMVNDYAGAACIRAAMTENDSNTKTDDSSNNNNNDVNNRYVTTTSTIDLLMPPQPMMTTIREHYSSIRNEGICMVASAAWVAFRMRTAPLGFRLTPFHGTRLTISVIIFSSPTIVRSLACSHSFLKLILVWVANQ